MSPRLVAWSLAAVAILSACGSSGGESNDVAADAVVGDSSGDGLEEAATNPDSRTAVSPEQPAGSSSKSCLSKYSAGTLLERAFAFHGTVVDVGREKDPRAPEDDVATGQVQFEVHDWFAGGTGGAVTVWMQREVRPGDRLLVAGEPRWGGEPLADAIAWECGFTTEYSDLRFEEWSAAFADG